MKEATGGTMMLYIFLVFLAVYITFIAVAFNYARAFRIKNEIVDIIEQHEGIENFADNTGIKGTIATFLDKVKYKIPSFDGEKDCKGYDYIDSRGYCIKEYDVPDSSDEKTECPECEKFHDCINSGGSWNPATFSCSK